jgi:hypothetical protein
MTLTILSVKMILNNIEDCILMSSSVNDNGGSLLSVCLFLRRFPQEIIDLIIYGARREGELQTC